jgi:hypothetical protein
VPFCTSCGAAQIRFSVIQTQEPHALVAIAPANGGNQTVFAARDPLEQGFAGDNSRITIRAALYAGIVGAFLSSIPVGGNFILALPIAGFLSVVFYHRWTHRPELRPSAGFKLGALAGLFGFLGFLIYTAIATTVTHAEGELRQQAIEVMKQQQAHATDPQARQMFDYFMTPQGMMIMMGVGFLMMGVIFVLLSGAGASLSASLLRRKTPPDR